MKRRLLAVVLCLAMMMALAVPAFADTTLTGTTDEDGLTTSVSGEDFELDTDYTIDVIGKLDSDGDGIPDDEDTDPTETPVVAIDVYWTDMVFNYTQSWDDVDLTYIWTWQNGGDYIRVDNRSSVGVDVSVSFTGDSTNGYDDSAVEFVFDSETAIAGSWDGSKLTLGYGNQATEDQLAEDAELVVAPTGTLNVNVAEATTMPTGDGAAAQVTLGQITVNVTIVEEPAVVIPAFPTDEPVWVLDEHETPDNPAVYTVVAGQTYTILVEDGIKSFPVDIEAKDDSGNELAGVTVNEQVTEDLGGGLYHMTRSFVCDASLIGQTVNLEFILYSADDGTTVLHTWYYTLHVVAE